VQINFIFTDNVHFMYVYCVYPAMSNSLKQLLNFTEK